MVYSSEQTRYCGLHDESSAPAPASPKASNAPGTRTACGAIVATALEGDRFYVYVGNSGGGLRSYDLSSSSRFTAAGNWSNTDVRAYSVRVEGDTLFAGTFEHGLGIFDFAAAIRGFDAFIFDVSDPTNPQLVRQCIGVEKIDRLEARDSHLFVASGYLGLQVYDTSLGLPKMTAGRDGGLGWNAPDGIPFPVQGSHDLIHWNHLGRFNRANLDQAIEALGGLGAGAPSYFRALER